MVGLAVDLEDADEAGLIGSTAPASVTMTGSGGFGCGSTTGAALLAEVSGVGFCAGNCELITTHVIRSAPAIRPKVRNLMRRFRRDPSNSGGGSIRSSERPKAGTDDGGPEAGANAG